MALNPLRARCRRDAETKKGGEEESDRREHASG
jgi:hypothetical protein